MLQKGKGRMKKERNTGIGVAEDWVSGEAVTLLNNSIKNKIDISWMNLSLNTLEVKYNELFLK